MPQKTFNYITGVIFAIIGVLHLIRSIFSWSAEIGGVNIVVGLSVVAFILAFFLAYTAFSLTKKESKEAKEGMVIKD